MLSRAPDPSALRSTGPSFSTASPPPPTANFRSEMRFARSPPVVFASVFPTVFHEITSILPTTYPSPPDMLHVIPDEEVADSADKRPHERGPLPRLRETTRPSYRYDDDAPARRRSSLFPPWNTTSSCLLARTPPIPPRLAPHQPVCAAADDSPPSFRHCAFHSAAWLCQWSPILHRSMHPRRPYSLSLAGSSGTAS